MSPSSVNFVINSFQDFTLYVNRNTQHGMQIGSGTRDLDVEYIRGDVEDHRLREELRSCQHFMVESDDGGFRYFFAHENNTLQERSKLVCTKDDLAKLKHFLTKTDVIESCSRETMNTKWRFYKLTNLTVFAALLKNVPMGCKNAVLTEPLLKNHTINCLRYEEKPRQSYNINLCLFRAPALHLHGTQRLEEETIKLFNVFINKMEGLSTNQIQGVHMNDTPIVEDLLTLNILLYDIDIVDGNINGELARRHVQKYESTVRLLRYKNHKCYVNNNNADFQYFRCPNCDSFFKRTLNLERNLTTCSERVKTVNPRNVYEIPKTLFDKLDSFGIKYTSEQTLFKINQYAILNRFVSKRKPSETQIKQRG